MGREFFVVVEQDEEGFYVGEVPQLAGCYSQARTLDELLENMREVILLCLEAEKPIAPLPQFVGIHKVIL
jgi:predicted RNase H-like HicB family nuclease